MAELSDILELTKRARTSGEDLCLATIVGIEGSAYRRTGARMLLTSGGGRAGTISGGCLEAEVAKKAWWLTAQSPSVRRYSSFYDDDGDIPYGLGCGGTVIVLLERGDAVSQTLQALRRSRDDRTGSVIVARIGSDSPGTVLILDDAGDVLFERESDPALKTLALEALQTLTSHLAEDVYVEYVAPPPALCIFGAGDDAKPLVELADALGWHVTVADGRSNLLRPDRFALAARVVRSDEALAVLTPADAVVVMTHSYEQDRCLLRKLIPMELKYLGVLGPRLRTQHLMDELAGIVGLSAAACMVQLHSPVGLDLGGHSPASIALSIAAEIQACFAGRQLPQRNASQPIHV